MVCGPALGRTQKPPCDMGERPSTTMSRTTAKLVATSAKPPAETSAVTAKRHKRIAAFGLDVILLPLIWLLSSIVPIIGPGLMTILYMSLKGNVAGSGRSLGRAATEQRLLSKDGEPLDHGKIIARNALRFILWLAVIPFFVDVLLLLFGDGRLLADRICNTQVFEDPEKVSGPKTESEQIADHLKENNAAWDERHDQQELEQIAAGLAYDGEEDVAEAELAEFERRLQADQLPEEDIDPFLVELAKAVEAMPSEQQQEVAEEQVVEQH